jgi:carboxynorspermidine decarboxylase
VRSTPYVGGTARLVNDRWNNLGKIKTPVFIVDEVLLERNLQMLDSVQKRTGCKILLALKGFAMWSTFPLVRQYLHGITASGPIEARLGREEFGKEVHTYAPAYSEEDIEEVIRCSDHILFNSFHQFEKYRPVIPKDKSLGMRVNPEYAEVKVDLYNPCGPCSRLGVTLKNFQGQNLDGLDGLHFHAMCEQGSDTLQRIVEVFEAKFGQYLHQMKWLNLGGGHHITRDDYDIDLLCRIVSRLQDQYKVQVYLEPGEAVALNTGVLVASVLDIVDNGMKVAILDTSAEAHMPDVLAMPYRPNIIGAGHPGEKKYTYRLGGLTCLAGDVIGDYSFDEPLMAGSRLIFLDMAHYSMVKTTTFNGVKHPDIAIQTKDNQVKLVRRFGYEDYRNRLS